MGSDALTRGRVGPASPLIDPRLRDRRIEVARDRGRKRLRRLLWLVVALVVVGAAVAAVRSPLLDVDRRSVEGATGARAEEVRRASGISTGDALIGVDLDAARASIETLPWVASASVERSWPATIEIAVEARTAVAVVGDPASSVDATGHVLGPATGAEAHDLPQVLARSAAPGQALSAPGRAAAEVLGSLPGPLRAEVRTVHADGDGVDLELRDGIVVAWGDARQASAKADALRVLLAQDDRGRFERIDVSVPRASTITFRDEGGE